MPHVVLFLVSTVVLFSLMRTITAASLHLGLSTSTVCDQGDWTNLTSWERELMMNYKSTSTLGQMCFDTTQGVS